MKTHTIYDIKYMTSGKLPYFFDRKSMKFFNQKMKDFHVNKTKHDDIFYIWAFSRLQHGTHMTERYFYKDNLYHTLEDAVKAKENN